jgi:hypothetical protein
MVKGFSEIFDLNKFLELCKMHFFFSYEDITDMIIWTLSHVLIDSPHLRESIINSEVFKEILKLAKKESLSRNLMKTISWLFSNLYRNKSGMVPDFEITKDIINICQGYLYCKDNEIIIYCVWTLSHMCEFNYSNIENIILDSGAIVKILGSVPNYNQYQLPVLSLLGNMLSSDEEIMDVIIINLAITIIQNIRLLFFYL